MRREKKSEKQPQDRALIPPLVETENCEYQFHSHGGCSVDYVGPYRPGPTTGSCFPKEADKDEECFGWPDECQTCAELLS